MRSASRWSSVAGLCGLGLAACASELAGSPDLLAEVKRYYDRYALEQGGLCDRPEFGVITGSSIQEQSAGGLVVQVRYVYSEPDVRPTYGGPYAPAADRGPDASPVISAPGAKGPSECRGFGSRRFTIARRPDGFEVVEMTGPQHRGIKIIKIDDSNVW